MSTRCSENSLPLRQTCNRCRELKVRCQRRQYGNGALSTCVRCSRAAAICTYSPQQRSGRPRFASKNGGNKQPATSLPTPPSTSSSSLDTYDMLSSTITPDHPLSDLWLGFEPNEDDANVGHLLQPSEEPTLPSTFVFGDDSVSTEMEEVVASLASNGSPYIDDIVGEDFASTSSVFKNEPQVDLNNTSMMIEELCSLNLRIYKATTTFPMQVLRDEIIEMADNLLRILAIAIEDARKVNQPVCTLGSLTAQRDHYLRRDSMGLPIHSHNNGARIHDTGSVLMIFACYQRLLDLFKQVCLKLHRKLSESYGLEAISPASVSSHRCDASFSSAQAVMTLELISHLTGRLHRGLNQLITALNVDMQPLLSPEATSSSYSSDDLPDGSEPRATARANVDSCFQGAKFVIESMAQAQSSLYAHIKLIKASIEESNGF